jgi:hypothetical protein
MDYSGLSYDTCIELVITNLNKADLVSITIVAKRYSL